MKNALDNATRLILFALTITLALFTWQARRLVGLIDQHAEQLREHSTRITKLETAAPLNSAELRQQIADIKEQLQQIRQQLAPRAERPLTAMPKIYGLTQTTAPSDEPLTLGETKSHLRITYEDEDAEIWDLVKSARNDFEEATYRQLLTATWQLALDGFPAGSESILLPRAPLVGNVTVNYSDTDGNAQVMTSSDYVVTTNREPGEIRLAYNATWPATRDEPDAVTIDFDAGYGAREDVPPLIRRALLLMVGSWWEFREELAATNVGEIPRGAARIIEQFDLGDWFAEYG